MSIPPLARYGSTTQWQNTFDTSRTSMPATLGGPGFGVINGHLYIAGTTSITRTLTRLYDYDIAAEHVDTASKSPHRRERAGLGGDRRQTVGIRRWPSLPRFGHLA